MEKRLYFLPTEESPLFWKLSEKERFYHIYAANREAVEREMEAQCRAREESEATFWKKYGDVEELSSEELSVRIGEEMRALMESESAKERTASTFTFCYLVGMGEPGSKKRGAADRYMATIAEHIPSKMAPDTLDVALAFYNDDATVSFPRKNVFGEIEPEVEELHKKAGLRTTSRHELPSINVCLFVIPGGLAFETSGARWVTMGVALHPELIEGINARNARMGWTLPSEVAARFESDKVASETSGGAPALYSDVYSLSTTQETDALVCSASDGKRGTKWRNEIGREVRVYETIGMSHRIEIPLDGSTWDTIEQLTNDQNSDFALALFYIAGILCPPPDSGRPCIGRGIIDLNDVMEKIGWLREKPNATKKEHLRRTLWRFLVYGEEARVVGARSVPYHDKVSKKTIPTYIESPVWKILDKQFPEQRELFAELKPAPVAVEIAVSLQFQRIFSDRTFAQYMPLGELLGAIPPHKVGGDWARVVGLVLAKMWRCKPREAKAETLRIRRRDILTHFAPKTQTVQEILDSTNPKRAIEYYRDCLSILHENGLIDPVGDAAKDMTPTRMLEPYGRKGWGEKWLDGYCGLRPGPKWEPAVLRQSSALPPLAPRDLTTKKQGRPRKKATA